jgi:hypothetical protein
MFDFRKQSYLKRENLDEEGGFDYGHQSRCCGGKEEV